MKTYMSKEGPLLKTPTEERTFKVIESRMRQLIYSKALKPGDKLPSEKDLAAQFKVGRLSVREALRALEQAGLIYIKQGSTGGSYVRELDGTVAVESMIDLMWQGDIGIRDLTDARSAVEQSILEKAFGCLTEENLSTLEQSVQAVEISVTDGWQGDYSVERTLTNFHMTLARSTNNPIFPIILRVLMELTLRVMRPANIDLERLKRHAASHRAVFDALKKRDLNGAQRAMEEHMLEVESRYAREVKREKA